MVIFRTALKFWLQRFLHFLYFQHLTTLGYQMIEKVARKNREIEDSCQSSGWKLFGRCVDNEKG